jgi:hypothetical protein
MNKNNKYNVYCYICDKLMNYNYSFKHRRTKKHLKELYDNDENIISNKIYDEYKNYNKGQKKLLREITKDKEEEFKQKYKLQQQQQYNNYFI